MSCKNKVKELHFKKYDIVNRQLKLRYSQLTYKFNNEDN